MLARYAPGAVPGLSTEAAARLRQHDWPGNVRELDNVIQRALILATADTVTSNDLQIEDSGYGVAALQDQCGGLETSLRASESEIILDALKAENGRRKAAAERLGISPRTLRYKLARLRDHGIAVEY
jgi:two-component system response regulator FlrC